MQQGAPMKNTRLLIVLSLISIVLLTLHVTDDIVRGISPAGPANLFGVAIFVVLLIGPLLLAERRSGTVIMLVGGLFALAMPVMHMRGAHYPEFAASRGGFFFVWTLFALGCTGTSSVILALRALFNATPRGATKP